MFAGGPVAVDEVSDNSFVGISRAVAAQSGDPAVALSINAPFGKVRHNQFIGNDSGISLNGWSGDFGTTGGPGGNVFRCNSALAGSGADLVIVGNGSNPGTLSMVGNAWDHVPPTQFIDTTANGADISVTSLPGAMFDLSGSTLAIPACPADRVPGQ